MSNRILEDDEFDVPDIDLSLIESVEQDYFAQVSDIDLSLVDFDAIEQEYISKKTRLGNSVGSGVPTLAPVGSNGGGRERSRSAPPMDLTPELASLRRNKSKPYHKCNDPQFAAVTAPVDSPLLIIAGAGSGKTMTMCLRMQYILETTGCKPHEILAITFTRNAADEMRTRMKGFVGDWYASRMQISTFHSFCLQLCRKFVDKIGRDLNFSVVAGKKQLELVINALTKLDIQSNEESDKAGLNRRARAALQMIGKCKTKLLRPADIKDDQGLRTVYEEYERQLHELDAVDFSDFARLSIEILNVEPSVLELVNSRYKYVLVDEFQDTSRIQFQLLKLIGRHRRVTAVGDDWQSIYSFQGADVQNFENFSYHFSESRDVNVVSTLSPQQQDMNALSAGSGGSSLSTVKLEQNFRSTSTIVKVSNAVISNAESGRGANKQVWTSAREGPRACAVQCRTDKCELEFVLADIERRHQGGTPYRNMAILFRTNKIGQEFQDSCVKRDLPFMCRGTQFYKTSEIRDILGLLSVVVNERNDLAVWRAIQALRSKIEQSVLDEIKQFCQGTKMPLLETLRNIVAYFEVLEKAEEKARERTLKKAKKTKEKGSSRKKGKSKRKSDVSIIEKCSISEGPEDEEVDDDIVRLVNQIQLHLINQAMLDFAALTSKQAVECRKRKAPTEKAVNSRFIKKCKDVLRVISILRDRCRELTLPGLIQRTIDELPSCRMAKAAEKFRENELKETNAAKNAVTLAICGKPKLKPGDVQEQNLSDALVTEARWFVEERERGITMNPFHECEPQSRAKNKVRDALATGKKETLQAFLDHVSLSLTENEDLAQRRKGKGRGGYGGKGYRGGKGGREGGQAPPPPRDAVWMGTAHQSKGLQWEMVYVVRFNEGSFPLSGDEDQPPNKKTIENEEDDLKGQTIDLEEERRLVYVALSRAESCVCVSYAGLIGDTTEVLYPSRYLKEIPSNLLEKREQNETERFQHVPASGKETASHFQKATLATQSQNGAGILETVAMSGGGLVGQYQLKCSPSGQVSNSTSRGWSRFLANPIKKFTKQQS